MPSTRTDVYAGGRDCDWGVLMQVSLEMGWGWGNLTHAILHTVHSLTLGAQARKRERERQRDCGE